MIWVKPSLSTYLELAKHRLTMAMVGSVCEDADHGNSCHRDDLSCLRLAPLTAW